MTKEASVPAQQRNRQPSTMRGTAVDDAANRGRTVAATEARRRQGAARLATILAVRIDDLDDKMLAALASAVDAEITERGIVVPSI